MASPAALLDELRRRGFRVRGVDGSLHLEGPAGALPAGLRQDVQAAKAELLELVRSQDGSGPVDLPHPAQATTWAAMVALGAMGVAGALAAIAWRARRSPSGPLPDPLVAAPPDATEAGATWRW